MDRHRIKYTAGREIDTEKWNQGIRKAFNGNIFAYAWYLDVISPGWNALVSDDYRMVMPLPEGTFMQRPALIHPFFSGPLGIYSSEILSPGVVASFVKRIPPKYCTIRLKLNKYNKLAQTEALTCKNTAGYDMDLISSYNKIKAGYDPEINRQLKQSRASNLSFLSGVRPNDLIMLYQQYKNNIPLLKPDQVNTLRQLIAIILRYNMGEIVAVYDRHNNLCAASLFTYSHEKATCVFFAGAPAGDKNYAFSFMLDSFIREHSGKGIILELLNEAMYGKQAIIEGMKFKAHKNIELEKNTLPWHLKLMSKL